MDPNKKYENSDFLDFLFQNRNKEYGAYELRRKYEQRLRNAVIITAVVCGLLIAGYAVANYINHRNNKKIAPIADEVKLENVNVNPKTPPPPPPPPTPPPPVKPTVKYTPPKVVKDNEVQPEEKPPPIEEIKQKAVGVENIKGDPNGIDPGLIKNNSNGVTQAPPSDANKVFKFVEQPPTFPGGENALLKYLHDHIHYPAVARDNGISGTVTVTFVVGPDGSIRDVKTIGTPKGGGLEQEAVRVVKSMPRWRPGKQNGRAVNVQFNLPVRFQLQ